jgi:hypothetical protein
MTSTLDEQAEYLTAVQNACRKARDSRNKTDLIKAAALLDSDRMDGLPQDAQVDLHVAYGVAALAVTGFGA